MAKQVTTQDYIEELKNMVVEANDGKPFPAWLLPQLRSTAMNMTILDKLQEAIDKEKNLVTILPGSTGQQKMTVNPLLDKYYKAQQVLMSQFAALGLTCKSSGSDRDSGTEEFDDPMASLYNEAKK